MKASELVKGGFYNWKNQPERLVFLGKFGSWNQFAKVGTTEVWCEVLDEDMYMLEPTLQKTYNFGQLERRARSFLQAADSIEGLFESFTSTEEYAKAKTLAREYIKAVDAIDGQPTEEQSTALKLAADNLTNYEESEYESL